MLFMNIIVDPVTVPRYVRCDATTLYFFARLDTIEHAVGLADWPTAALTLFRS